MSQQFPVVDRDLYRVDGFLMEEFTPIGQGLPPYEHEMVCFSLPKWQEVVTAGATRCP